MAVAADRMDGRKGSEAACQVVHRKDHLHPNGQLGWFWRRLAAWFALRGPGLRAFDGGASAAPSISSLERIEFSRTSSAAVAIFSRSAGWRKELHSTSVPISTRWVASANAASMVQHSHMPRVGSPGLRYKKWSASQMAIEAICFRLLRDGADRLIRTRVVGPKDQQSSYA